MFLAMLGYVLQLVSYAINYAFLKEISWQFLYLELIYDFCGSYVAFYMMEYSYVADVTQPTER